MWRGGACAHRENVVGGRQVKRAAADVESKGGQASDGAARQRRDLLNVAASAPVRLATWVYSGVGRASPGFPVSRNVMHGCVALSAHVSAVKAAVSAVTWSMATCQPCTPTLGTLRPRHTPSHSGGLRLGSMVWGVLYPGFQMALASVASASLAESSVGHGDHAEQLFPQDESTQGASMAGAAPRHSALRRKSPAACSRWPEQRRTTSGPGSAP